MNYLIADFIIRIKNNALSKRKEVELPFSNINKEIGKVLVKEGFLENIKEQSIGNKKSLKAVIRYESRIPVLTDVDIISKPSLRVYLPAKRILEIGKRGRKKVVVSTSQGVMTAMDANKKGLGGEILFAIW
jgi:small subunit ribosomal protein S8